MSTPIAVDGRLVAAPENPVGGDTRIRHAPRDGQRRPRSTVMGLFDDAVMLLLVILLFPLVILVCAMPLVLFVRLLIEIAERM